MDNCKTTLLKAGELFFHLNTYRIPRYRVIRTRLELSDYTLQESFSELRV